MKRKTYKIEIDAPREKVWKILWEDETYRQWTAPFMEGSHAKSDWEEGSKIQFLGPNGSGMLAIIEKKEAPSKMLFKHIGIINEGVEDTESEKVKEWAPAEEQYFLSELNDMTHLRIDMDINEDYLEMFDGIWPKALNKIKVLAEK
jgi:hypothetical protein